MYYFLNFTITFQMRIILYRYNKLNIVSLYIYVLNLSILDYILNFILIFNLIKSEKINKFSK